MSIRSHVRNSRRDFLCLSAASAALFATRTTKAEADSNCPRCGGIGRIPLLTEKPFVWLKGTPLPKLDGFIDEQHCPICQTGGDKGQLVTDFKARIDGALDANKKWEERTGWKLACVVTRHAAIHTQLKTTDARAVGTAVETLMAHLKRTSTSLALASTRPDEFGLVQLWEKASWEAFRKVMESMYSLQQLGPAWTSAREVNAYDHVEVPHTYETPQTIKTRPPSCGAVFITTRRQLQLAADWRAPFWLAEGFSAYGDNVVHKLNRWFTVYHPRQVPVGDWMVDARKLVAEKKQRPWKAMFKRELVDWEAADHIQTMSMAAFLFESEPAKFLGYLKRLRGDEQELTALEEAYGASPDEVEQRWGRWVTTKK
jgi:hypothetical protein